MDLCSLFDRLDVCSTCPVISERFDQTGTDNLNEEVCFAGQPSNTDYFEYFCMPECVVTANMRAVDGGDDPNTASRQRNDADLDFNQNSIYEPCPNEGCGCTGSYNGGAGAGTAACCDCEPAGPPACGCQDDSYQSGLVNKKPESTDQYKPVRNGASAQDSCCYNLPPLKEPCPYDANTYQRPLTNKKPDCPDIYVSATPDMNSYGQNDCSCCTVPDTYELVRNTDAQRYKGQGLDRSAYFADGCCGCGNSKDPCS